MTPAATFWYFSYWSGVPNNGLEVYVRQNRVIFAFPTNDCLFGLFVGWSSAELPRVRADIEGQFLTLIDEACQLRAALRRNQEATNRFYMAQEGMIPPETFFNPENLLRIMATAMAGAR